MSYPHDQQELEVTTLKLGDVLANRYRLDAKVGEGGMGSVFFGTDIELGRPVALKVLSPQLVYDRVVVDRFENEARLTAGLEHPNVVPIYDVGRHGNRPFMVMKALEGQTLAARLAETPDLTLQEVTEVIGQVAAGLDYIHARGYIHRDIKAGNIYLSPTGQATILDFGILRSAQDYVPKTRTGMVMGTPQYMAPEQALGAHDIDYRVDLYALAILAFECLTHSRPFEADNELRILHMQANQPPPRIRERDPSLPPAIDHVFDRALAKNPELRYQSGAELTAALAEALQTAWSPSVNTPSRSIPSVAGRVAMSGRVYTPAAMQSVDFEPAQGITQFAEHLQSARKRTGALSVIAVGVVTLVAGTLSWRALSPVPPPGPSVQTEPAVVDAPPPPSDVEPPVGISLAPQENPSTAGSNAEPTTAPGPTATPEAAPPKPTTDDRRVKRAARAKLNIVTSRNGSAYWAEIYVDGTLRGRSPILLELTAGRHTVVASRPGLKPIRRQIRAVAGKTTTLRLTW